MYLKNEYKLRYADFTIDNFHLISRIKKLAFNYWTKNWRTKEIRCRQVIPVNGSNRCRSKATLPNKGLNGSRRRSYFLVARRNLKKRLRYTVTTPARRGRKGKKKTHSTASDIEWGTSAVPLTPAGRSGVRSLHTRKQTGRGAARRL